MRGKSFSIALSAVSCALATVLVCLGVNIPVLMFTGYVFGSVVLMLPLAKDFRLGGFLAYLATCLLCLAFGGIAYFYRLFPFVAFFGLHPLVNSLQKRYNIKKWVARPIKAVWFDGMLCATVALLFSFNVEITLPFNWPEGWLYLIVVVLGTLVFLPYDWVMFRFQQFVDFYVRKLERGRGGKAAPPGGNAAQGGRNDADDVFGSAPPTGSVPGGGENDSPDRAAQDEAVGTAGRESGESGEKDAGSGGQES